MYLIHRYSNKNKYILKKLYNFNFWLLCRKVLPTKKVGNGQLFIEKQKPARKPPFFLLEKNEHGTTKDHDPLKIVSFSMKNCLLDRPEPSPFRYHIKVVSPEGPQIISSHI